MNRLPELPESAEPETAAERGARCLQWILETRVTATVSSVDLERADSAAIQAGCASDWSEQTRERVSEIRHAIAATLRIRRELDKVASPEPMATAKDRPNAGPMAPLRPQPITRPPSPVAVEPDINF